MTKDSPNPSFQLTPPEVITPVAAPAARSAVPIAPQIESAVDDQVDRFVEALLTEDLQSDAFRARLDSAFALGQQEISSAAALMQGRLLQANFVGVEDSPAFKAVQDMRTHLDALNPGREGDLAQPQKLFGLIPWGNKLQAYFRKFESAGGQLQQCMQQLYAARDDMQRDVVEIDATRGKLWESMQKVAAAMRFAEQLDQKLAAKVDALKSSDPQRAKALELEVLFYARQNLQDMLTQQAVNSNGYLALDVLKKTGREMMNGCTRVATTGMSALAVAQTVARASGNQIRVMEMLGGVNTTIETLIEQTGKQLNAHANKTGEFAQSPLIGIEKLKDMFDQTFAAMDAMDNFRSQAVEVMGRNNAIIKEQLSRAESYTDKVRLQQAREVVRLPSTDPVAM